MLLILEDQVKETLSVAASIATCRRAYLQCPQGAIQPGPRLVMDVDDSGNKGQWLTARYTVEGFFGSKFSAVFPKNSLVGKPATISTISLYSAQTGELNAMVEANALTAIKTGASAAIATDLLARKDASRLAIIGSGLQAFHQVLAICQVRKITELLVYDVNADRATRFIGLLKAVKDFNIISTVLNSANEAAAKADILCTCTTSKVPVFSGAVLRPGTHINAVGSYAPDMQEIDTETVLRANCILTEHVDGMWEAAGDILEPYEKGLIDESKIIGSISDVLSGAVKPKIDDRSITLYESVGSAVLDLAIAVEVYRQRSV